MKISIITVVYNRVDEILKCIESVLSQSYLNYEHIIIDGLSNDGTLDVIKSAHNEKIKLISEKDNGIFDALNKGISMSSGDVIGVLNSDDYYANSEIFMDVADLFKNPDLDMVFGDVEFFHSNNEKTIRRYNSGFFKPNRIKYGVMPAHPSMFLRSCFYENNLYKTNYKIAADFEMIARIFSLFNISYHYIPSTMVRMQTGGVSTSGIKANLLLNREIIRACQENGYTTNWFNILLKYPHKLTEYFLK
jgi:glycosyltransferase involved in cell wall biosynthesis